MTKSNQETITSTKATGFSLIPAERLRELYTAMVKCRELRAPMEEEGERREATLAGVGIGLRDGDTIVHAGSDRQFDAQMEVIRSAARPASDRASELLAVTGVALANKTKKNEQIVVEFFDASLAQELWRDALFVAAAHQLPMIFVRSGKLESTGKSAGIDADANELPVIPVDGSDAMAVYRVASESIGRARRGRGPTLIDCKFLAAQEDPIVKMEQYLVNKGLFSEEWKQELSEVKR